MIRRSASREQAPLGKKPQVSQSHSGPPTQESSVQEWTGSKWVVVDPGDCPEGYRAEALDPSRVRGTYVGERVVTPWVKS